MKIGDLVKLKKGVYVGIIPEDRKNYYTATIKSFLCDINGGVYLNRDLRGHRYWDIEDLTRIYKKR